MAADTRRLATPLKRVGGRWLVLPTRREIEDGLRYEIGRNVRVQHVTRLDEDIVQITFCASVKSIQTFVAVRQEG